MIHECVYMNPLMAGETLRANYVVLLESEDSVRPR